MITNSGGLWQIGGAPVSGLARHVWRPRGLVAA
jgi:hypothetical protein